MILILHSNQIFALGLKTIIESSKMLQVHTIAKLPPRQELDENEWINKLQVLLTDESILSSPARSDNLKMIKRSAGNVPVLFIAETVDPRSFKKLFSQRLIDGVIMHHASPVELLKAIEAIMNNEVYIGNGIDLNRSRNYHLELHEQEGARHLLQKLTARETEVMKEVVRGATSARIGQKFFLSPYTIKTHRKNILKKLGVANTLELISFLQAAGFEPDK